MVLDANAGDNTANNVRLSVTVSVTVDSAVMGSTAKDFPYSSDNIGGPKIVGANNKGLKSIAFNGPNPPPQTIELENTTDSSLDWDLAQGWVSWLKYVPPSGTLAAHSTEKIIVEVIPAGLKGKSGSTDAIFGWKDASPADTLQVTFTK